MIRTTLANLIFGIIILILFQCGRRDNFLSQIRDNDLDFSFLDTSSYSVTILETTPEILIGEVNHVLFDSGYIFIFDSKKTFSVFVFNEDGSAFSKISKLGDGPGEYGRWLSFDLDRARKHILIFDYGKRKILRYTYSGSFICESSLADYRGTVFSYLGNEKYAFWMHNYSDFQILITDSVGIVESNYIESEEKYSVLNVVMRDFFSKNKENNPYFIPIWEDKIYRAGSEGVEEVMDLKLKEHIVSSKEEIERHSKNLPIQKLDYLSSLHVNSLGQFFVSTTFMGDNQSLFSGFTILLVGNINTGVVIGGGLVITVENNKKYGLGIDSPDGHKDEYFVKVVDPQTLLYYYPDRFPNLKPTDNPCLFFYKIKI